MGAAPPDPGLQARDFVPGRRHALEYRPIRVDRYRNQPSADGDAAAAGRSAAGAMRHLVPRIPRRAQMLVGARVAMGERHRVGLADRDHPRAVSRLCKVAVCSATRLRQAELTPMAT